LGVKNEARFLRPNQAKKSKVDFSSKAKGSNVREGGTFARSADGPYVRAARAPHARPATVLDPDFLLKYLAPDTF
jgi:hypothetical protein